VDALRAEIKQTRAELGETVQALAAKTDVKARAKEQVELTKQKAKAQMHDATGKVREVAAAAVGAASDKVRTATAQAGDKVALAGDKVKESSALAGDKVRESGVLERAQEARTQVRRNPVPFAAVLAAGVALVGIILIVRGRRK
jgi:cobalamin biosynthesis Mg chelatase CobN